jgi:hypothetical protein
MLIPGLFFALQLSLTEDEPIRTGVFGLVLPPLMVLIGVSVEQLLGQVMAAFVAPTVAAVAELGVAICENGSAIGNTP